MRNPLTMKNTVTETLPTDKLPIIFVSGSTLAKYNGNECEKITASAAVSRMKLKLFTCPINRFDNVGTMFSPSICEILYNHNTFH